MKRAVFVFFAFSSFLATPLMAEDAAKDSAPSADAQAAATATAPTTPTTPDSADLAPSIPTPSVTMPAEPAAALTASATASTAETVNNDNLEFVSGEVSALDEASKSLTVKLYGETENAPSDKTLKVTVDTNTDITDGEQDRDLKSLTVGTEVDVEYDPATSKATYIFVY